MSILDIYGIGYPLDGEGLEKIYDMNTDRKIGVLSPFPWISL